MTRLTKCRFKPVGAIGLLIFLLAGTLVAQQPVESKTAQVTALELAQQIEQGLVKAIEQAEKSVVAIARVRKEADAGRKTGGISDPLKSLAPVGKQEGLRLETPDPTSPEFVPNQYFTGVVIDREGMIVTT